MDKKLFELQVMHNYFVRTAIVAVCKIVLWSITYLVLLYSTAIVSNIGITWANSSTLKPAVYTDKVTSATGIFIFIISLIYLVIVVSKIVGVVTEHKLVLKAERQIYEGIGDPLYTIGKIQHSHSKKKIDDNEEL